MQAEKLQHIDKKVSVLAIQPNDVERVWPLVHFLIAEALKFSGQYAEAHHIKENLINKANRQTIEAFLEKGIWKIGI